MRRQVVLFPLPPRRRTGSAPWWATLVGAAALTNLTSNILWRLISVPPSPTPKPVGLPEATSRHGFNPDSLCKQGDLFDVADSLSPATPAIPGAPLATRVDQGRLLFLRPLLSADPRGTNSSLVVENLQLLRGAGWDSAALGPLPASLPQGQGGPQIDPNQFPIPTPSRSP